MCCETKNKQTMYLFLKGLLVGTSHFNDLSPEVGLVWTELSMQEYLKDSKWSPRLAQVLQTLAAILFCRHLLNRLRHFVNLQWLGLLSD